MENTRRSVFALNGVTGMLIATVLLLSILACLTTIGIMKQQSVMQKPYELKNSVDVKMNSSLGAQKNTKIIKE